MDFISNKKTNAFRKPEMLMWPFKKTDQNTKKPENEF